MSQKVSIVGIGRLGLCMAASLAASGFEVVGVDVRADYVDSIRKGTFQSPEPGLNKLLEHVRGPDCSGSLRVSTDLSDALNGVELIWIMVATPTGTTKESTYDCQHLGKVLESINDARVRDKHIVIGCTVMPGYIDKIGKSLLVDCENTTLSYNPEFIAQGNILSGLRNPDVVLVGEGSPAAGQCIQDVYRFWLAPDCRAEVKRMSPASAEIAKLALNCFVTTKIAFANFIGDMAIGTYNANPNDILDCVGADKRVGHHCLQPGFGFGGPCFPRDNRALGGYADSLGLKPWLPEATDEANAQHAEAMAEQLYLFWSRTPENERKAIIFEDVGYKPNCPVPIIEESQRLAVAKLLRERNVPVVIHDRPEVLSLVRRTYGKLFAYEIKENQTEEQGNVRTL